MHKQYLAIMATIPALNYPITGPPKPSPTPADGKATFLCAVQFAKFSGSVPLRREIRDLQRNFPDQWTLYILGLQAFQQLDQKSDLSWYGIAGMSSEAWFAVHMYLSDFSRYSWTPLSSLGWSTRR